VARLGGPDEVVVANVEHRPGLAELHRDLVDPLLRRDASSLGGLRDLLTVLVESGENHTSSPRSRR